MLVVTLLLIPEEASIFIGDLRLPPERFILLALFPIGLWRLMRQVSGDRYRFVWSDALILPAGIWMVLSVACTEGLDRAIVGGGVTALEFTGSYIVARTFLTEPGQAMALARLLGCLIAIVGVLGLMDTLSGSYALHHMVASITGYPEHPYQEPRYGLIRGEGTLEHPILLGTVATFGILLGTALRGPSKWFVLAGSTIGLFTAVSSGPILTAVIALGCLVYRKLTHGFDARWRVLGGILLVIVIPFFLFHPAPFGWLLGHLTLDPSTGFYRLLIWNIAGDAVLNSPIFGVGLSENWARPDWMPSTVDSVWLRSSMSFGIPGALLIAGCMIGSCSRAVDTAKARLTPEERWLGLVLSVIVFSYLLCGFTVHFWGIAWVLMGLFAGMRAHIGALAYSRGQ